MSTWSRRGLLAAATAGALSACSGGDGAPGGGPSPRPATGTADATTSTSAGRPRWSRLARHVDGTLTLPQDPTYDQVKLLENPRFDRARPLAVLTVASAADLATGLGFAADAGIPVTVRSGGHSYPGWSSGGGRGTGERRSLVLDCRALDRVRLSADGTATIGAGAALAPVYDALGSRGRALAGGSCGTVGIGGLTLGGGVGVLTRAMGLTCDALTGLEVVTADGTIRRVSADQDTDLFWALRGGGGGQVGVVTSFSFATTPAPTLQTVYLQWPISAAPSVIAAWQSWAPAADPRLWSTLKALGGAKHPSGPILLLSGTWTGPASGFDGQLAGLLDHVPAPSVRSTHTRDYRSAMLTYAGCADVPIAECTTAPGGALRREAFGATSHVAHDELSSTGIDDLLGRVDAAGGTGLLEAGLSMDALGGHVRDLAPGDTAFVHREALATVQYTATYTSGGPGPADDYVRGFRAAMRPHWGNHAYVNYADPTIRGYRAAYFGANAARLADVKRTYDPDGFFTQPQPW